eukprot:CAMPEP_0184699838 /NCGR_PEP_ID=MMETSP0313-20130426/5945_1 /TAXON_ID=2792 /ORGANISM="Porphyridium aerugineum, Strain SAG 1380-2" /LENGTH=221 /DNA_ID=CAMNT_0027158967 /DNA_START=224 /DNA_END=889 /DNA_ORIENTATION=+
MSLLFGKVKELFDQLQQPKDKDAAKASGSQQLGGKDISANNSTKLLKPGENAGTLEDSSKSKEQIYKKIVDDTAERFIDVTQLQALLRTSRGGNISSTRIHIEANLETKHITKQRILAAKDKLEACIHAQQAKTKAEEAAVLTATSHAIQHPATPIRGPSSVKNSAASHLAKAAPPYHTQPTLVPSISEANRLLMESKGKKVADAFNRMQVPKVDDLIAPL